SDGNCCGRPTTLYAQGLSADGLALSGSPVSLLQNDPTGWEGGVIEAPTMLVHDGRHFLFYSGGAFASAAYGVGVATCESAYGPCRRLPTAQPLLASRDDAVSPLHGPGHQALFRIGSRTWMAYHAWEVDAEGRRGTRRVLHIDRIEWKTDAGPSTWRPPVRP
ncbi:MAG: family 43 glycosylhydrolase, partial [Solirubrobacteraceae bacterium]|nr:family 43 glycosylhydrolase [Solirubrobacteraceae bacterium]